MAKLVRFDWAIKYLLRNKANFDILEGFLSELLKTDIKIESLLESEGNKYNHDDKFNRVDLLVHAGKKERIIIEVQCSSEWDYLSRILYGTAKTVTEHIREGASYHDVCKVISVSIVFFDLGEGKDYLYKGTTVFRGLHYEDVLKLGPKEMEVYGQNQTPSDVFPEYYIIKVNQFRQTIKDKFDEWVYFLKNEQIQPEFVAQGIQSAAKKLDVLQLSEEKRRAYEHYQEVLHYDASMVLTYEVEAKLKGREEERMAIAKKLLVTGMSLEDISEVTQLSMKVLSDLKKS